MPGALNAAQLEILKLFRNDRTEEELQELKSLLTTWLAAKVTFEADKSSQENGYTAAVFEKWKQEHFRRIPGGLKGQVSLPDDFDEPLDDLKDYM